MMKDINPCKLSFANELLPLMLLEQERKFIIKNGRMPILKSLYLGESEYHQLMTEVQDLCRAPRVSQNLDGERGVEFYGFSVFVCKCRNHIQVVIE